MTTHSIENSDLGAPGTDTETAAPMKHLVTSIESFVGEHGGSAKAVLQPMGRAGVRITLVGDDGVLGDRVAPDLATANAVVASLDSVETAEWDRELTSAATPRRGHYAKMAGWVAGSSKFPKARNGL